MNAVKYHYRVAYSHAGPSGDEFGVTDVTSDQPITEPAVVDAIRRLIAERGHHDQVEILDWQHFEERAR